MITMNNYHPMLQYFCSDSAHADDYFGKCLNLLVKYKWVYDFQLTHFFKERVWENIPPEWSEELLNLSLEELNHLPFGNIKESFPASLQEFLETCQRLSVNRSPFSPLTPTPLPHTLTRNMNPKKRHEVSAVTAVVHGVCSQQECRGIVDVGSGLGYLSLALSHQFGHKVLGLECEESRCHAAELRAKNVNIEELKNFQSVPLRLDTEDESSIDIFKKVINDYFKGNETSSSASNSCKRTDSMDEKDSSHDKVSNSYGQSSDLNNDKNLAKSENTKNLQAEDKSVHATNCTVHSQTPFTDADESDQQKDPVMEQAPDDHSTAERLCLIGLHCCGDLTPTMLKLYAKMPQFAAFVNFSCCYHKMSLKDDQEYREFPLSSTLHKRLRRTREAHANWRLNTYALRLAAQETRSRWLQQDEKTHISHQKHVAFRGILELAIQREQHLLQNTNCRFKTGIKEDTTFESYVKAVMPRLQIRAEDADGFLESAMKCYQEYEHTFKYIEPLTGLQVCLQGVLESLVLVDRVLYLREQGLTAQLRPVMDDSVSPRNMAIIAWKTGSEQAAS